jgi:hypothetical protein
MGKEIRPKRIVEFTVDEIHKGFFELRAGESFIMSTFHYACAPPLKGSVVRSIPGSE